jgi:uncharacterized protein with HEPN domain
LSELGRALLHLRDMLSYSRRGFAFVEHTDEDAFQANEEKQFATIRALEVIGEAAKQVPEPIRLLEPQIPWQQIAGMRNKLIHHYFGVRMEAVWSTAKHDLPALIVLLEQLLERLESKHSENDG